MTRTINKPAFTPEQIIRKIRSRGISNSADQDIKDLFFFINYYRFLPYIKLLTSKKSTTNFEEIKKCYWLDKKLRVLLLSITESIENFIKNDITKYFISQNTNFYTFFRNNPKPHHPHHPLKKQLYEKLDDKFQKGLNDSLNHYKTEYNCNINNIPIWVFIELLDFGDCLWIIDEINRLDHSTFSKIINDKYGSGVTYNIYKTCAESTKDLRNHCAHGNRLYMQKLERHRPAFPCWNMKNTQQQPLSANNTSGLYRKLISLMCFFKNRQLAWLETVIAIHDYFEDGKNVISADDYSMPQDWETVLLDTLH